MTDGTPPPTAAATARRRRIGQETKARALRAAGWLVVAPEQIPPDKVAELRATGWLVDPDADTSPQALGRLFREVFDLADQVAAAVTDAEVDAALRRVVGQDG